MINYEYLNFDEIFLNESFTVNILSPLIITNVTVVTVEVTSPDPQENDWIGAYSPANVKISQVSPIKYAFCKADPSYLKTGKSLLKFNMTNVRSDITFYLFTGAFSSPIAIARSASNVSFANPNAPLRPRVVLSNNPNQLKLLWSSDSSTLPKLKWGIQSNHYEYFVEASTQSIDRSSLCGPPANETGWFNLGLIHTATFDNLLSRVYDTTKNKTPSIYYTFGDDETNDYSEEHILQLPPLPGQQPSLRPTTLALFADLGRGSTDMSYTWHEYGQPAINTTCSIHNLAIQGKIDGVFHFGDISYANGYLSSWDFFLEMISPIAATVVYMTGLGNHELDWPETSTIYGGKDSGGECGFLSPTLLPLPMNANKDEAWWSYNIGLFHIISLSSEHRYDLNSKQYNWLSRDLQNVNRNITPWIILGCHRAMYINSGNQGHWDIDTMNSLIHNLEPLLYRYRVDIGFYGHTHVVQRQSAVYNKTVMTKSVSGLDYLKREAAIYLYPNATIHFVTGTGGAPFYKNEIYPPPEWNEKTFYRWGYTLLYAVNASYMYWEWIDGGTNEIIDRAVIIQDPNRKWETILYNNTDTDENSSVIKANQVIAFLIIFSLVIYIMHRTMLLINQRMRWFQGLQYEPTRTSNITKEEEEEEDEDEDYVTIELSNLNGQRCSEEVIT